ncbi:acyl-CoA dehydrogenase family protein [Pseudalkalibacillus salsuginis]|uniref:acyl-CoA dehydrogenase family protein n=1 Tax=Pseudalkalibacillus salsuginis TaxID=2910972 RepID=UPI001F1E4BD9|nr:acyl-CoA dehydrogenase family protein [Pseudalkalibacillus salsuginis]MCF6411727.1 acyl-CoA/acyl-ACP dehydrogenase [Pseudalkalibacillus salsuginis]
MWDVYEPFITSKRQEELFTKSEHLAAKVRKRAAETDRKGTFSLENLKDLKDTDYVALSLPKELGGEGLSLYEFVLLQEKLAEADGSVALSIGWHLGIIMEIRDENLWEPDTFKWLCSEVSTNKKIINRAATEPATGSPTRGGIPETRAVENESGYTITGRKSFTTMAEVLDYYLVSAYIDKIDEIGWFLIERNQSGVSVEHTWDTLGMRGTGSDDLVLNGVHVDKNKLVELKTSKQEIPVPKGWLLHIPSCYLGIAIAARNEAIDFAKKYQPNSLQTPISKVHHVKEKIGQMDLELLNARHFMYAVAEKWDRYPEERIRLGPELAAVKTIATNAANKVVDLSMRIVGGRGLSKTSSFERYYRDVRAGLHNPPMDDAVIQTLAQRALEDH